MSVFSHIEFDDHQQVVFISDEAVGLKAIIAVHNTNLGPSLGGCRLSLPPAKSAHPDRDFYTR